MSSYYSKSMKNKKVIIYGEGIVGRQVLQVMREQGLDDNIVCFAKSQREFPVYDIEGIEVRSIYNLQEYYKDAVFLLAVSSKLMPELIYVAKKLGIRHYVDSKKIYCESYQKNNWLIFLRIFRNKLYMRLESKDCRIKTKDVHAVHITYCVTDNAGDTMLSQCVRRFLEFRKWNIKEVSHKVDSKLIDEINQADMVVIGGGGLFLPDTNKNNISGWQWAISDEQLDLINVPVVIYAVGYNYFNGQENTERFISSVNHIVRKADFVGLRNKGSIEKIRGIVSEELKEKIIYQPCTTTLIRKIYNVDKRKNAKIVMLNVAFDREERRFGEDREKILNQIAEAALQIQEKGYPIMYVAHCDMDLKFLPYLDKIGVRYKVKNLTQSLPKEIIKTYQKAIVVIGMRGHAQMIPFGIGVKIISLGTHDKMRWFLEDINLEDCYIDLREQSEFISHRIMNVFTDIVINYPEQMNSRLNEEQEKLWKISCKNKEKITWYAKEKTLSE